MVSKGLGKAGAPTKAQTMMYNLVVQAVILNGRKIWVVADVMITMLEVFHLNIDILSSVMTAIKGNGREWG